jgi:putative alpha-1,2-mannosidase
VVNGKEWGKPFIPLSVVTGGGSDAFVLGAAPNLAWGSAAADRPPSLSTD